MEAEGIYRNFYDRVAYSAAPTAFTPRADQNTTGYGFGGGIIIPVIPRRLDFQGNVLAGKGIGRYGAGLLPDSTFNTNGSIRPINEVISSVGLTFHATPAIDVYAWGGLEKETTAYTQTVRRDLCRLRRSESQRFGLRLRGWNLRGPDQGSLSAGRRFLGQGLQGQLW